ncbi:hypothetical protein PAPHI01_0562 [Pancytospora philotis]|nr:hypothetical protein PAPHI01_0562 [Pancytospora philotis]
MLLTDIPPRLAAALALLSSRQDTAMSLFDIYPINTSLINASYEKFYVDCMSNSSGQAEGENRPAIRFFAHPLPADKTYHARREFLRFYTFCLMNPMAKIMDLMALEPTYKRLEMLLDIFTGTHTLIDASNSVVVTCPLKEEWRIRVNWVNEEIDGSIQELLIMKIIEAVSPRTGEYLKNVFTADTREDALLHLLRRSTLVGVDFYSELSALLDGALKGDNIEERIWAFVVPLMEEVAALSGMGPDHTARCGQIMLDKTAGLDRELAGEISNWMSFLQCHLNGNTATFSGLAGETEGDTHSVTTFLNDFYRRHRVDLSYAVLDAFRSYYLKGLDVDGQVRLKEIAEDGALMNGLPPKLIRHLLNGCDERSVKYSEAGMFLTKRLSSALETQKE